MKYPYQNPEAVRALKRWVEVNGLDPSTSDPGSVAREAFVEGWRQGRQRLRRRDGE